MPVACYELQTSRIYEGSLKLNISAFGILVCFSWDTCLQKLHAFWFANLWNRPSMKFWQSPCSGEARSLCGEGGDGSLAAHGPAVYLAHGDAGNKLPRRRGGGGRGGGGLRHASRQARHDQENQLVQIVCNFIKNLSHKTQALKVHWHITIYQC